MLPPLQSLKQLEVLVQRASEALRQSADENRGLRERLRRLDAEHRRLREELKEARLTLARHERLRARLARLSERLEKAS
ncbi:MAG: hypothetical protein HY552_00580 [Elusimicrobia bacterium]|nr:hypothetical protein [Elusimicrobiota bacterium]